MKNNIISKLFLAVSALLAVICLAAAQTAEFSLSVGEGFVSVQDGDSLDEISQLLGTENREIHNEFKVGGCLYIAASKDKSLQIKVISFEDNFSQKIKDISALDSDALNEYGKRLAGGVGEYSLTNNSGRTYIRLFERHSDSGGEYASTQYITVANGRVYSLAFYDSGNAESAKSKQIFKTFNITADSRPKTPVIKNIFILAAIAVFAVTAAFMVLGIIKDFKKS